MDQLLRQIEIADNCTLILTRPGDEPDLWIARLHGNLDAFTSPAVQTEIEGLIGAGCRRLVLSCRQLDFISSQGLGVIVTIERLLLAKGGSLRIAALSSERRTVFEVTQLTDFLKIHDSEDAALQAFRG